MVSGFIVALDTLDELSRSIVVLREVEGMSYDEIAELLNVPLPTVKTRLLRARRRLGSDPEGVGMMLRHPSRAVLRDWLTGESEPETTDTSTVTSTPANAAPPPWKPWSRPPRAPIGDALAIVLAPPGDLAQRLQEGVTAKLSSRQMMEVVADLFGAGIETTRLLLIEDDDDDS